MLRTPPGKKWGDFPPRQCHVPHFQGGGMRGLINTSLVGALQDVQGWIAAVHEIALAGAIQGGQALLCARVCPGLFPASISTPHSQEEMGSARVWR